MLSKLPSSHLSWGSLYSNLHMPYWSVVLRPMAASIRRSWEATRFELKVMSFLLNLHETISSGCLFWGSLRCIGICVVRFPLTLCGFVNPSSCSRSLTPWTLQHNSYVAHGLILAIGNSRPELR